MPCCACDQHYAGFVVGERYHQKGYAELPAIIQLRTSDGTGTFVTSVRRFRGKLTTLLRTRNR